MNYKRLPLLLLGVLCFLCTHANQHHPIDRMYIQTISNEKNVIDGSFEIAFKAYANDDMTWQHSFVILPDGQQPWFGGFNMLPGTPPPGNMVAGDSTLGTLQVFYQPGQRPQHYQKVKIGLYNNQSQVLELWEYVYIYFTPYNTVEVWSIDDFEMLKRTWDSPTATLSDNIYVDPQQIPQSDLSDEDFADESVEKEDIVIPGLAYTIPMLAPPASNRGGRLFSGTVTGRITTSVSDPTGATVIIPIWDIRVELRDRGRRVATGFTDESGNFSITYTDYCRNNDSVRIFVRVIADNRLRTARVRTRLGRTRRENLFRDTPFAHDEATVGNFNLGDVSVNANGVKPQLLHWANRSREVIDTTTTFVLPGGGRGNRVDIMIPFTGAGQAMFLPGGYRAPVINLVTGAAGVAALLAMAPLLVPMLAAGLTANALTSFISNQDCIYMGSMRELNENVTYHEYGHRLMWHLQSESWVNPLQASFRNHSSLSNNNNEKLTWNEGFAHGFSAIVDAWAGLDDGEFGGRGLIFESYEDRRLFGLGPFGDLPEDPVWTVADGGTNFPNSQAVTHGYVSEWSVGAAIYDLWDGPNNMTANGNPTPAPGAYDDGGSDQLEMSLDAILLPFLQNTGTGGFHAPGNNQEQFLLGDVVGYHRQLMLNAVDCGQKGNITASMTVNGIRNLDAALGTAILPRHLNGDFLNSDSLYFSRNVTWNQFRNPSATAPHWTAGPTRNNTWDVSVTELPNGNNSYNFTPDIDASGLLSDDLLVTGDTVFGAATLRFNHSGASGWANASNDFGAPAGTVSPPNTRFFASLCGGMNLSATRGGRIVLGNGLNHDATVMLKEGATLTLGGDVWPDSPETDDIFGDPISKGKLIIHDNSRFIVERGATLIINRGADIQLLGNNSVLEIHGNIIIADDALFTFTGDGEIYFNLPSTTGNPNVQVGDNSHIRFRGSNINDKIFHIEESTYFMPTFTDNPLTFSVEDGFGFLAGDAFIDVATATFTMVNTHLRSTPIGFRGVIVNGYPNSFINVRMDHCNPGIETRPKNPLGLAPLVVQNCDLNRGYRGIVVDSTDVTLLNTTVDSMSLYGVALRKSNAFIENCDITKCGIGLMAVEGIEVVNSCNFTFCDTGFDSYKPTATPKVTGGSANSNIDYGYRFHNSSGHAELEDVEALQNEVGVQITGGMTLVPHCSKFNNNTDHGIEVGIGAVLDMENYAYNEVRSNLANIYFMGGFKPLLMNGNNDLTNPTWNYSMQGTLIGSYCSPTYGYNPSTGMWEITGYTMPDDLIDAQQNTWNSGLTAPGSSDYILTDLSGNCNYTVLDGSGGAPYSCASPLRIAPGQVGGTGTATGRQLESGAFRGQYLSQVIARLEQREADLATFEAWYALLTTAVPQPSALECALLQRAYDGLASSFGQLVAAQQVSFDPQDQDPLLARVRAAIDWQLELLGDAAPSWHQDRLAADRARFAYHLGHLEEARSGILQALGTAKGLWAADLREFDCHIAAKAQLHAGQIDIAEYFLQIQTCAAKTEATSGESAPAAQESELKVTVSPNPTSGHTHLKIRGNAGAWALQITDLQGRVMYQKAFEAAHTADMHEKSLDLHDLSQGMYLLRIQAAGEVRTKRLMIQK